MPALRDGTDGRTLRKTIDRRSRLETALICRNCGSTNWEHTTEVVTPINSETGQAGITSNTDEGFRCARCKRKANLENNTALRKLPAFIRLKAKQ
jgi:transposase-like protein